MSLVTFHSLPGHLSFSVLHIHKTRKERTFIKHNLLRLLHVVLPHRQVTKDRKIVFAVFVSDVKVDGFKRP